MILAFAQEKPDSTLFHECAFCKKGKNNDYFYDKNDSRWVDVDRFMSEFRLEFV